MTDEERYGIAELAAAADVSVRTVRYYIAEGLVPPAVTAGARSHYTREHLDRLRVIGRMKEAYLPLREIRRQLATLDDDAIRQIAEEETTVVGADAMPPPAEPLGIAETAEFLHAEPPPPDPLGFISGREDIRAAPSDMPRQSSASDYIARVRSRMPRQPAPSPPAAPRGGGPAPGGFVPAPVPVPPASDSVAWRRIAIGEEAELLIREDAYQRRRDKVEWLVDWARKVLG